jgi:DNA invertase Pin-like site-specific DNA recombinase
MTFTSSSGQPKRVAIYARVSTRDKDQNPKVQLDPLHEYCRHHNLKIFREYVDHVTGTKKERPGLDKLMADAREKRFDVVLVYKFDRFARSVIHLNEALVEFKALAIDFVAATQQIDTATPMGRFMFHILGALAEMEHELIVERVQSGVDYAQKHGTRSGKPFGRPRGSAKKPDPKVLAEVRKLRAKGWTYRGIGEKIGCSAMTVHNLVN